MPLVQKNKLEFYLSLTCQGRDNLSPVPRTDAELANWEQYHRVYGAEFKDLAQFMVFGNEEVGGYTAAISPDVSLFDRSSFCGTTRDFLNLYLRAYRGAKSGAPKLPFGLAEASDEAAEIAKKFTALTDSGLSVDCWAFNAYGNTPSMAANIASVLSRLKTPPAFGVIPEKGISAPVLGEARTAGEKSQAAGCVETYVETKAMAPWLKRITWFIFDGSNISSSIASHGVFDGCGPRPLAAAYATMTDTLGAGTVGKNYNFADVRFYTWRRINGDTVGVAWAESAQTVMVETDAEKLEVSDLYGNRTAVKTSNGLAAIPLTVEPQYIIGAKKIALSRRLEFRLENATESDNGEARLRLTVRNNGKTPAELDLTAQVHPTTVLIPRRDRFTVPAETEAVRYYSMRFFRHDFYRKLPVELAIIDGNRVKYAVNLTDNFAFCVHAPSDLYRMELGKDGKALIGSRLR